MSRTIHPASPAPSAKFPRILVLLAILAGAAALAACSTTEGFGNDVKHLGGNIEDSAARNK